MANKIAKLTMLTMLFSLPLGFGLTSVSEINTTPSPTKTAVSYASSDDLNDHDTDHSSDDGWASFSDSNGGSLTGGSNESEMKYYYLSGDITLTENDITIEGYVALCLNGKTLTGTGNDSVITISSGAYFNLCDCSGDDSGIITNGSTSNGGGIYMNRASDTSYSTFNMYGGTISGNTGSDGGGVYVNRYNIFNMYGGVISDNTAYYGGGVYLTGNTGTINIYGGTISGNTATESDTVGIICSGTLNIYGGYLGDSFVVDGGIDASIKGGYFSSTAYESAKYYVADGYKIISSGDSAWPYVVVYTDYNNHTHGSDWIPLKEDDFDSNGDYASGTLAGGSSESETKYYYLYENVYLSSNDITISNYVTLCLNGKTLTGTGSSSVISVFNSAYLNLCDCSGNNSGEITGANTRNDLGNGGINIYRSTFNMYGGTIFGNIAGYGGGVKLDNSVFNMYGGTISGNEAEFGGGVFASSSTFNMYEGAISNNEASNCGGVRLNSSTFNMYAGTITGNTDGWYAGGMYLTVDPSFNVSSTFNMYNGTISENKSNFGTYGIRITSNCSFYMYGGYLGDDFQNEDGGTYSIMGGYFAYNPKDYITSDYQAVDISLIGSDLDENYVAGFDYAVYATSTTNYTVENVDTSIENVIPAYEELEELYIRGGDYTSVAYTYSDGTGTVAGLPTNAGEYTVTAHILYTTTDGFKITNYYAAKEFKVTISNIPAIISADSNQSKTYDGTAASPNYTVTFLDTDITDDATVNEDWYDEEGKSIDSAPTDVGTYKVILTVADTENYDGTSVDVYYTITKGQAEISAESTQSKTYDGTAANVDYEVTVGDLVITAGINVTWYDEINNQDIGEAPTDVGTYRATITVTDGDNYYGKSVDVNYTITKGEAVINADATQSKTYDGTAASVDYTVYDAAGTDITSDAIVTWYDDGVPISAPTDVGTYTATITVTGDENYEGTSTEITYTITKGEAVITAELTQSKTYDGTAASPNYTVTFLDTDITNYATVNEDWYDDEGKSIDSAPTDVGTYTVTLTVADGTNYEGTSIDVTYTITENTSSTTPSDEENESGESGETGDTEDTGTSNDDGDTGSTTTSDDGDTGSTTTLDDSSDTESTTTPDDDGDNSTSSDTTRLSAGAITGITIASVFVVGLIAFLVYFFVFRKKKETSK